MIYCIDPEAAEPILLINKHIGNDPDDGMGIDGALFQEELLQLDGMGKKRIQVWINSPGGVVMDGYNMFSAIMDSKTPVDTYAKGMVASIAGPIFLAGRNRFMTDYSCLMMHNPFGGDDVKQIAVMKDSIATMLAAKSNISIMQINSWMNSTTWLKPSECLQHGLCTSIEVSSQGNKKWATAPKYEWQNANKILNNILKIEPMESKLSAIINYLKIDVASTEDTVLTEVQNRITAAQGETVQAKADLADITNKYNDLVANNAETVLASKRSKAKNMLEGMAKVGRIKDSAINTWLPRAIEDFDEVETLLKDLPITRAGVKVLDKAAEKPVGYTAAGVMATINNRIKDARNG